jgi:putative transposase
MQFVKGGFSFRLKRETGFAGEVWQRGFTDRNVRDLRSFDNGRRYIADNPLKAGLATSTDEFPWCFAALAKQKSSKSAPLQS